MKFRIRRTSDFFERKQPCEGAEFLKVSEIDDEKWFWVIEINTLEELINLRDNVGNDLILRWPYEKELGGEMREIEIYDDYRE